jgi:hypothetical protein
MPVPDVEKNAGGMRNFWQINRGFCRNIIAIR